MYKLIYNSNSIKRISDGAIIPPATLNIDYQAYLAWVDEGNVPEPADIPPALEPAPEWVEFNNALLADATWNTLSEQLPVQILIGVVSASVAGNTASLQFALDTAKAVMASLGTPIPAEALAGWQAIADLHYIPITF